MVDKNPYEKDEVSVPNFGETEEKGVDPIFNMDTSSVTPETDTFNAEDEAESSSKVAIVVLVVLLVLFLVGAVAGLLFGISKSKEVTKVIEEYDAYKVKTTGELTEKDNLIKSLQTQLEEAKASATQTTTGEGSSQGTSTSQTANAYYTLIEGVSVRPSAGATGDSYADYSKLPTDIKNIVFQDGKKVTTRAAKFPVYETKEAGGRNWGRIADNAWVCIDAEFATKQ